MPHVRKNLLSIWHYMSASCKKRTQKKNDTASLRSGFDNGKPTSFFRVSKVLAACKGLSQI